MRKLIVTSSLLAVLMTGCASNGLSTPPQNASGSPDPSSTTKQSENTQQKQTTPTSGEMKVYFLDVGQGDSILIKTPKGQNVLIDGGNNDKGDTVVKDLKNLNVTDINVLVATHPDADHIGGLDNVLKSSIKVDSVYTPKVTHTTKTYEDFVLAVKNKGLKFKEAKAGVDLGLDGIGARFVGPVKEYGQELNDWSAVLKVTNGKNSFLFTGDAPVLAEQDMINAKQDLKADVLKVGHHGAKTSTSQPFLDVVKPKYGVVSVGKENKYGHPTDLILSRLKKNNVQTFRTDELGTVVAISNGQDIVFENSTGNPASTSPIK